MLCVCWVGYLVSCVSLFFSSRQSVRRSAFFCTLLIYLLVAVLIGQEKRVSVSRQSAQRLVYECIHLLPCRDLNFPPWGMRWPTLDVQRTWLQHTGNVFHDRFLWYLTKQYFTYYHVLTNILYVKRWQFKTVLTVVYSIMMEQNHFLSLTDFFTIALLKPTWTHMHTVLFFNAHHTH